MPYRKEVFIAPGIREVKKYHTARLGGKKTRAPNEKRTAEAVQKINARRAKEKLYRLLVTNFRRDDYRVDLTYKDPPPSPEEAGQNIRKFIRRLRDLYRKKGTELRYIYVTEYVRHRPHHHIIVNQADGIGRDDIGRLWPYAKLNFRSFRFFDGAPEDCEALAEYFVKETSETIRREDAVQKLRWCASKNLKKPDVKYETIYSRKWTEKPKPPKGYQITDVENGYTADGYPYQFCRMIRLEEERHDRHRRRDPAHGGPHAGPEKGHRRGRHRVPIRDEGDGDEGAHRKRQKEESHDGGGHSDRRNSKTGGKR